MRNGILKIMGAMSLAAGLIGCGGGSGSGTGTGGSSPSGQGGSGTGGSGVGGHGVADAGGSGTGAGGSSAGGSGAGGAGGGTVALHDCLPACIANLRASCERPLVDAGTCFHQADAGSAYCYSNGVHEIQRPVDGGEGIVTFTKTDGQTVCYLVLLDSQGVEHYETPSGQDVAQVTYNSAAGTSTVTCDGMTQTVSSNDPSCAMLQENSCGTGACP